jgi:hypothetical protein
LFRQVVVREVAGSSPVSHPHDCVLDATVADQAGWILEWSPQVNAAVIGGTALLAVALITLGGVLLQLRHARNMAKKDRAAADVRMPAIRTGGYRTKAEGP